VSSLRSCRNQFGISSNCSSGDLYQSVSTLLAAAVRRCHQENGIVEHKGLVHEVGLGLVEVMYLHQPKLVHRVHSRVPSV
jgi:hypothetical protein